MTTSPIFPQEQKPKHDLYHIACQLRFLSEAIPNWALSETSPSLDAAYGIEIILSDIAEQAEYLELKRLDNKKGEHENERRNTKLQEGMEPD